ncbi:N-acetylneuraminate synthase family protein [Spirochaeta dissipatitropha]
MYVIAEIGTGHNGCLNKAEKLIQSARDAGADCAKFQTVFADEIVPVNVGDVPLPGGSIPLYERFRELEQNADFYLRLKEICAAYGIDFLSSPFGLRSLGILLDIGADALKIASPELNHFPLLRGAAESGLPLIVSTGVSMLQDIERALQALYSAAADAEHQNPRISLLHCVTAYPAPAEDYNLRLIPHLSALFGVPVGVSDHSLDPVLVPLLSAAMGASIVEKHICLSHTDPGLDDPIALEPRQFSEMVRGLRFAEEEGPDAALQKARTVYGSETVDAVLGTGQKLLAGSEQANYGRTNRSIHALRDLQAGSRLKPDDFAVLRTEKILHPGIPPQYAETLVGVRLSRTVDAGQGIRWEDILTR